MRDKDLHTASRRRFIKILSAMGISSQAIQSLSQEGLAQLTADPTDETPILVGHEHNYPDGYDQRPEVSPVYKTIDYDRWAKIQATFNAANTLEKRLYESLSSDGHPNPGYKLANEKKRDIDIQVAEPKPVATAVKYNSSSKNNTDLMISVNYKKRVVAGPGGQPLRLKPTVPRKLVEQHIPSSTDGQFADDQYEQTFEGIPVDVKEKTEKDEDYFNSEYDPVVGGIEIGAVNNNFGGSACFSVYHSSRGERVMSTAGHVLGGWEAVEQPYGGRTISTENDDQERIYTDLFDGAWFEVSADQFPGIGASSGGTINETLSGTRGIDWLKAEGYYTEFTKQGKSTGRTDGFVDEIESEEEQKYDSTCTSEDGDSGGVYYQTDGGDYWVIGVHSRSGGIGNGIERLEERLNVIV